MLYLLTIVPIKWLGFRSYDNSKPRDPAFYDDPIRARALGAHQNGIEAFPFFAVAVLLAEFRAAPQNLINELAVLFLIVRIAYVFTYLGNRPRLRSILWNIGFTINIAIFFMPLIREYFRGGEFIVPGDSTRPSNRAKASRQSDLSGSEAD